MLERLGRARREEGESSPRSVVDERMGFLSLVRRRALAAPARPGNHQSQLVDEVGSISDARAGSCRSNGPPSSSC